jgi:uncharacterized membrane protein YedE/YeeE
MFIEQEESMKDKRYWSPYVAGVSLGLTLLATFYIAGRGLGGSGAIALTTAVGSYALVPEFISKLKYFAQYITPAAPWMNWNLFLLGGVFLGALAGALFSGNFKMLLDKSKSMSVRKRLVTAFVGGITIGFASRLARGCTSGVALTGGAQLALAGWIFVISMFAAGFIVAALYRRLWS